MLMRSRHSQHRIFQLPRRFEPPIRCYVLKGQRRPKGKVFSVDVAPHCLVMLQLQLSTDVLVSLVTNLRVVISRRNSTDKEMDQKQAPVLGHLEG